MDNEQLVNLITKEVMKRLNAMLKEKSTDDQKEVLVLGKEEKEVVEVKENDKICSMNKNDCCKFVDLTNEKLICETDLKNVLRNVSKDDLVKVLVSKKVILTPLAKDFIRTNKLQLDKK